MNKNCQVGSSNRIFRESKEWIFYEDRLVTPEEYEAAEAARKATEEAAAAADSKATEDPATTDESAVTEEQTTNE